MRLSLGIDYRAIAPNIIALHFKRPTNGLQAFAKVRLRYCAVAGKQWKGSYTEYPYSRNR